MVEIKWQDPPSRRGGTGVDYSAVIETLKSNPGKWALINNAWKTSSAPMAFRQTVAKLPPDGTKAQRRGAFTRGTRSHGSSAPSAGTEHPRAAPKPAHRQPLPPAPWELQFLADRRARGRRPGKTGRRLPTGATRA